ncbi:tRNA uridine(34) 5-carboxymethylaminomethyl modification radical SAM/GNAT enzyme Elp3 [Candidatus Peregrinibacteria bacterium]|nr:tRNA uridine(34) 5-carboxymethylaminomethyl modification radical SAM/GNAT enzyme Elp3 [Candidatus Peregrinibacteria bacterium]
MIITSPKQYREKIQKIHRELILDAINSNVKDAKELQAVKNRYSLNYKLPSASNVELIKAYRDMIAEGQIEEQKWFWKLIRKRGIRSKSGIANITVLTKGYPCPGKCIFCPTEPRMPKSYLSDEPAMMRAILNDFSAYKQVRNRLMSLEKTGHHTDKIDVIVSGGTFSFYPKRYQTDFTRGIYNALNYPHKPVRSLQAAQDINEKSDHRCIGLSYETRPDHINPAELRRLRKLGCTKIEIGLQSLNDRVLDMNKRGHSVAQAAHAIKLIRDAGYKINTHMMPNLYGSTPEIDLHDMKMLFDDSRFRPDWIKLYPCVVVPWSQLEKVYQEGKYKSYSDDQLVDLLVEISKYFPKYVRVTRMYRDIPSTRIISGSKITNLRQLVEKRMLEKGVVSKDIRTREIKDIEVNINDLEMNIDEFDASDGREFFITYDYPKDDKLCSLLRLRFTSQSLSGKKHFIEELEGAALVREVHTYGEQVKIDKTDAGPSQHIGLGRRMMFKAEEIAKKNGYKKLAVISGIGVREYYRKLGYNLEGTYMVKYL